MSDYISRFMNTGMTSSAFAGTFYGSSCAYVPRRGDTLESVAERFCTSVDVLRDLNGDCPGDISGMRIIVPC